MENEVVTSPVVTSSGTPPATLGTIGSLLGETFAFYKGNLKTIFYVASVPALLGIVISLFGLANEAGFFTRLLFLFISICQLFAVLALYVVTFEKIEPTKEGIISAFKKGASRVAPFVWISLLITALMFGSGVFLIIPAIIVGIWVCFSPYLLFAENKRGLEALLTSRNYVRNYWWSVFWRIFIVMVAFTLLNGFVAAIIKAIFGEYNEIPIGIAETLLSFFIVVPFVLTYIYRLYGRLKAVNSGSAVDDQARTKKWFIGLSIWGVVVFIAVAILVVIFTGLAFLNMNPQVTGTTQEELEEMNRVIQERIKLGEPATSTRATTTP